MTWPRTCHFFQLCWLVYQRYCFVSLMYSELISNTSRVRHWSLQRRRKIHYSLNNQTTDQWKRSLPPYSEVFKTIWKPPVQPHIQFWAQGVWSSWGCAHRGIPKLCSNEEYNVNNCQHRLYLITQMTFKSVYLEAKILHSPRKQKAILQRKWVFPCKTRGKPHLFLRSLSPSLFLGRANLPWLTHRSTNVPRYKVLIHRKQKTPKPKGAF